MDDAAALAALYPEYDFALLPRRAWAVGVVLDYLATLPQVEMNHIGMFGYSRDGKMAMIALMKDLGINKRLENLERLRQKLVVITDPFGAQSLDVHVDFPLSHLVPELGKSLLHGVRREELQDLLDRKALDLSSSVVSHLRWFLNGIFKLALSDGLVLNNPAAALRMPRKCQLGRTMRPLTEEEVTKYIGVFDLREKLISRLAIFEGLRPGEILALRWKALANDAIRVEERVYKRVLNTPKNGKTREGAISDGTLALLKG